MLTEFRVIAKSIDKNWGQNSLKMDKIKNTDKTVCHRPLTHANRLCGIKNALKWCIVHVRSPSGSWFIAKTCLQIRTMFMICSHVYLLHGQTKGHRPFDYAYQLFGIKNALKWAIVVFCMLLQCWYFFKTAHEINVTFAWIVPLGKF